MVNLVFFLGREVVKSKGGGKVFEHFTAEPETVELLVRTVHAANQLSMYGPAAHWCNGQTLPAEKHVEEQAAGEVLPELVARITKLMLVQIIRKDTISRASL